MARKVHGGRALLNLPGHHSTAAIVAEVEDTSTWPKGLAKNGKELSSYNAAPEVCCVITDCDKRVVIEFDIGSENKLENSLHKIDQMIDVLYKLRSGLEIENERLIERRKHIPADRQWGE